MLTLDARNEPHRGWEFGDQTCSSISSPGADKGACSKTSSSATLGNDDGAALDDEFCKPNCWGKGKKMR